MSRSFLDLKQLQSLPLNLKIDLTKDRIRQWINEFGINGVYVSFSGGKDSTVLLHIVRSMFPVIPAVFVNTGLEYPEIVSFVNTFDNVEFLKPNMNFKQVINKYGYPFISKEISQKCYAWSTSHSHGLSCYVDKQLNGTYLTKNGKTNILDIRKWKFLFGGKFKFSHMCCNIMKKQPVHDYFKKTGRLPFTAEMASESFLRTQNWVNYGCNAFNLKLPKSRPLSFWTEQDILTYININKIKIASIYGDIVPDDLKSKHIRGQLKFNCDGSIEETSCFLRTTGCKRSGCTFCGFGCHLEKPGEGRFEKLKVTHPKIYDWIMKPSENGGLNYKEVIDWLNVNGNLNIRY